MSFIRQNTHLSESISNLLIEQYQHEMKNQQVYKQFSTWGHINGFPGAEKWYIGQAEEEQHHAEAIFNFLRDSGITFNLTTIEFYQIEINEYVDLFKNGLEIEVKTTNALNDIFFACGEEKLFIAQEFVNRLLYEQLAEENEARTRLAIVLNGDILVADHVISDL